MLLASANFTTWRLTLASGVIFGRIILRLWNVSENFWKSLVLRGKPEKHLNPILELCARGVLWGTFYLVESLGDVAMCLKIINITNPTSIPATIVPAFNHPVFAVHTIEYPKLPASSA